MGKILFYSLIALAGVTVLAVVPQKLARRPAIWTARICTVIYAVMNVYYTFLSRVNVSEDSLQEAIQKYIEYMMSHPDEANAVERGLTFVLQVLFVFSPENYLISCVLNILLYMPLGYLLLCSFRTLRVRPGLVIAIGLAASCFTEALQWCTNLGMADAMDLVCNTAGTALGVIAYRRWLDEHWQLAE